MTGPGLTRKPLPPGLPSEQSAGSSGSSSPRRLHRSDSQQELIAARIQAARLAAQKHRLRIVVPCLTVGTTLFIYGTLAYSLLPTGMLSALANLAIISGGMIFAMSVLPTDRRLVQALLLFGVLFIIAITAYFCYWGHYLSTLLAACDGSDIPCWYTHFKTINAFFAAAINMPAVVSWLHGVVRLYTRRLLMVIWRYLFWIAAAFCMKNILELIAVACLEATSGGRPATADDLSYTPAQYTVIVCGFIVTSLLSGSTSFRNRVQARLAHRGESVQMAVAIAKLIGGRNIDNVLKVACSNFRCVTCDVITEDMLRDSQPDPTLFELSMPAKIGEVDAFISHSWSDDPDAKWAALQQWRQAFRGSHAREPTVWIDKLCIDQTAIDENLLCLPVFVAGSKKLVVLSGSTYLHRLWCVMEIFTFIQMGGSLENLELWALDESPPAPTASGNTYRRMDSVRKMRNFFADFDANRSSCYLATDRDRLFSIVEAGCGGLDKFNQEVRTMLLKASEA